MSQPWIGVGVTTWDVACMCFTLPCCCNGHDDWMCVNLACCCNDCTDCMLCVMYCAALDADSLPPAKKRKGGSGWGVAIGGSKVIPRKLPYRSPATCITVGARRRFTACCDCLRWIYSLSVHLASLVSSCDSQAAQSFVPLQERVHCFADLLLCYREVRSE